MPDLLLLLSAVLLLLRGAVSDQNADGAALLAFRAAVAGRNPRVDWSFSSSPCSWRGVACESGNVTILRLPGIGLFGAIPASTLSNLSSLHTLSLHHNALSGPLPPLPASLRNLYLHRNRLSGRLPPLPGSLVRLNLAGNNFSGNLSGLTALPRLRTLLLDDNGFSGDIPDLHLPDLAQLNFSYTNLTGSVPRPLRSFAPASFLGLSGLCGSPAFPVCPGESPADSPGPAPPAALTPTGGNGGLSGGAIAGIVVACVVAALVLALLLVFFCRRREARPVKPAEPEAPIREKSAADGTGAAAPPTANGFGAASAAAAAGGSAGVVAGGAKALIFVGPPSERRGFDLEDLLRASAEVLGKGTFGTAYKAVMEQGAVVAVKRLRDVEIGEAEFREKLEAVGAMAHPNIVPLRAYYYSRDEKLLVYDYLPMGSLSALLHGNRGSGRTPLNWEARSSIALAAARGIEYIHSTGPNVSHGNIKSSNVLLSKNSGACVSDHGLAHLVNPSSLPTRVAGYRAPEVTDARRVSQKADVYSFGVLLLELLTGKAPQQALLNEEGVDLPRWVQSVVREEWTSEIFDLELLRYQNVEEEMVQLLQLAMDCASQHPDNRPSMSVVVKRIDDICRSSMEPADLDQPQHPTAEGQ